MQEAGDDSSKPENMYSSLINLREPGIPEYIMQPKSIAVARFGFICKIPLTSVIFLDPKRRLTQSTKKKNKVDIKA